MLTLKHKILILDHDLVDKIKPGDRIQVVGVYRAMATSASGQASTSGLFQTAVLVNNIQVLGRDSSRLEFSPFMRLMQYLTQK